MKVFCATLGATLLVALLAGIAYATHSSAWGPDPVARRESIDDPWSTPVNLGNVVNTAANETRGSFWRSETLYFGRSPGPEGSTDIYVTTRERHGGH